MPQQTNHYRYLASSPSLESVRVRPNGSTRDSGLATPRKSVNCSKRSPGYPTLPDQATGLLRSSLLKRPLVQGHHPGAVPDQEPRPFQPPTRAREATRLYCLTFREEEASSRRTIRLSAPATL